MVVSEGLFDTKATTLESLQWAGKPPIISLHQLYLLEHSNLHKERVKQIHYIYTNNYSFQTRITISIRRKSYRYLIDADWGKET